MADAAKGLPVSHLATNNQLVGCMLWHKEQREFLMHNAGKTRDEKSIQRSWKTIKAIEYVISGAYRGQE